MSPTTKVYVLSGGIIILITTCFTHKIRQPVVVSQALGGSEREQSLVSNPQEVSSFNSVG